MVLNRKLSAFDKMLFNYLKKKKYFKKMYLSES